MRIALLAAKIRVSLARRPTLRVRLVIAPSHVRAGAHLAHPGAARVINAGAPLETVEEWEAADIDIDS